MLRFIFLSFFISISLNTYSQNEVSFLTFETDDLPRTGFYSQEEIKRILYSANSSPTSLSWTQQRNIDRNCDNYRNVILSVKNADSIDFRFEFIPKLAQSEAVIRTVDLIKNNPKLGDVALVRLEDLLLESLVKQANVSVKDFHSHACVNLNSSFGIRLKISNNKGAEVLVKFSDELLSDKVEPMKKIEPRQYVTIYELENSINLYSKSNLEPIWWLEKRNDTLVRRKYNGSSEVGTSNKFFPVKRLNVLDTKSKLEIRFDQEMLAKNVDFYGNISLAATLDDRPIEVAPYTVIGKEKASYGVKNKPIKEIANNFLNLILISNSITDLFYNNYNRNNNGPESSTLHELYLIKRDELEAKVRGNKLKEEFEVKKKVLEYLEEEFYSNKVDRENLEIFFKQADEEILELSEGKKKTSIRSELDEFRSNADFTITLLQKLQSDLGSLNAISLLNNTLDEEMLNIFKNERFSEKFKDFTSSNFYAYEIDRSEEFLSSYGIRSFLISFDKYLAFLKDPEKPDRESSLDQFLELVKKLKRLASEVNTKTNWEELIKEDYNPIYESHKATYEEYVKEISLCREYIDYFINSGQSSMEAFLGLSKVSKIEFYEVYRNINSRFDDIQYQNLTDSEFQNYLKAAETINRSIKRLSEIATGMLDESLSEYLRNSHDITANSFSLNTYTGVNQTARNIAKLLEGSTEVFEKFQKNISLRAGNRLFNRMLYATIDLAEAGAKHGEVLEVKVLWYNIGSSSLSGSKEPETGNGDESIELSTAKFIVRKTGWHLDISESAMLINRIRERSVINNVSPSNFKPTAGASLLWTYNNDFRFDYSENKKRKKDKSGVDKFKKIWKWFEPSIGINVSYLDFDTEKTFEVGLGPIIGLWNNRLFFNAGYNLSVKGQSPYYFGVGFSFSNIFDKVKGNIDSIER